MAGRKRIEPRLQTRSGEKFLVAMQARPGTPDAVLQALHQDGRHGMGGPSTQAGPAPRRIVACIANRNEQAADDDQARAASDEIARIADPLDPDPLQGPDPLDHRTIHLERRAEQQRQRHERKKDGQVMSNE